MLITTWKTCTGVINRINTYGTGPIPNRIFSDKSYFRTYLCTKRIAAYLSQIANLYDTS
jgi:hypothetical protein